MKRGNLLSSPRADEGYCRRIFSYNNNNNNNNNRIRNRHHPHDYHRDDVVDVNVDETKTTTTTTILIKKPSLSILIIENEIILCQISSKSSSSSTTTTTRSSILSERRQHQQQRQQPFCSNGDIFFFNCSTKLVVTKQQQNPSLSSSGSSNNTEGGKGGRRSFGISSTAKQQKQQQQVIILSKLFPPNSTCCVYKVDLLDNINNNIKTPRINNTHHDGIVVKVVDDEPVILCEKEEEQQQDDISSFPSSTTKNNKQPLLILVENIYPIPLLSISLLVVVDDDDDDDEKTQGRRNHDDDDYDDDFINDTNNIINNNDPLQQAYRKRRLVGKIVILQHQQTAATKEAIIITTRIAIQDVTYKVQSLTGIPSNNYNNSPTKGDYSCCCCCYKIIPSTRITFIYPPKEKHNNNHNTMDNNIPITDQTRLSPSSSSPSSSPSSTSSSTSPTADLLIQTINCIKNNIPVPQTFLLSGPPGVGKTYSIQLAIRYNKQQQQQQQRVKLISIRGSELLQESNPSVALKQIFMTAKSSPSSSRNNINTNNSNKNKNNNTATTTYLLFLDECDALVSSDPVGAMLATMLDRISSLSSSTSLSSNNIIVVGATNRIDSIPQYLRRSGRFDREIPISPPNSIERSNILHKLLDFKTTTTIDTNDDDDDGDNGVDKNNDKEEQQEERNRLSKKISNIAENCVGYVPADLTALVRRATLLAVTSSTSLSSLSSSSSSYLQQPQEENHDEIQNQQHNQENQPNSYDNNSTTTKSTAAATITADVIVDYLSEAMKDVGASALRDAKLMAPPKVSWDDIAGDPGGAKTALRQAIEWPRTKAKAFQALDLHPPRGILLHGPPGCAKTSLARAAAGASGVAFLTLSPADVYSSSYVGEAEAVVRRAFSLARSATPCILFFDEIDSIFGNNEDDTGRGSSAEARVLSTFLNEMDGIDIGSGGSNNNSQNGVLVLGATNRPWTLDAALLRPGRLGDKIIYLPPPDEESRRWILQKHFGTTTTMDLDFLASDSVSGMFTGAELVGACQEAKLTLLREMLKSEEESHEASKVLEQEDDATTTQNSPMKQQYLEESLAAIKPLLSDPVALQEFRLFGMQH